MILCGRQSPPSLLCRGIRKFYTSLKATLYFYIYGAELVSRSVFNLNRLYEFFNINL